MPVFVIALILAWTRISAGTLPVQPVSGCARLDVMFRSAGSAKVAIVPRTGCGPLALEVDSSARYDARRHVVHLRVRLRNRWTRTVISPVRLISWPDSFGVATADGPRAEDRGPLLRFVNADSTIAASAAKSSSSVLWRLDALRPSQMPSLALSPGQLTGWRTVDVAFNERSPFEFIVELRVEAERAVRFEENPPVRSAADFITSEPIVTDEEGFPPGRVLANVVELIVPASWSARERQDYLDVVRGVVIGASAPSGRDNRIYLVRLDPDSGRAPVIALRDRIGTPALADPVRPIVVDSLLAPEYRRSPMFASPVAGCATIHIAITEGASVVADTVPGPACGPIVPTVTRVSFDARRRVLHLHVVLANAWTRKVVSPARVFAWDDSLKHGVSAPIPPRPLRPPPPPPPPRRAEMNAPAPPRAPNRPTIRTPPPPPPHRWGGPDVRATWINADSSIGRGASTLTGAKLWRFDDQLGGASGRDSLGRAARSSERTLDLRLDADSITDFSLRLVARAENAQFVPPFSPASGDPPHAFDSANLLVDTALFGSTPVARDLMDITFFPFSTQLERQAVVDSIDGEVVGGFRRDTTGYGTYVVRVARATSAADLAAALEKVRHLENVEIAMPIEVEGARVRYADVRTPLPVRGCSTLRVELSPSHAVTTVAVPAFACGPLIPMLAGGATFDSATKSIHLPIALVNTWTRDLTAPIELSGWNDSIAIERPAALSKAPAGRYLRLAPPDEGGWRDDATILNTPRWSFERLMDTVVQRAVLRPGARTPVRDVVIHIQSGSPTSFTIRLRAQARRTTPPPGYSSAKTPEWVRADSNKVGDLYKHVVLVDFRSGASQGAMQAAIDSVEGTVIGVERDGLYVVRVPGGATLEELESVQARLRSLPVVAMVMLEMNLRIR